MSQIRAILSGKEVITANLIRQVAKDNLKLVRPMLEALKSGNIKEIAKYEDICTVDIDFMGFVDKSKQSVDWDMRMKMLQKQQKKKEEEVNLSKKEQAILKLLDLNIDAKKAQKAVEKVLDKEEGLEVSEIVIKAVQMIANNGKLKQKEKSKAKNMDENDIRYIVEEGRKNKKSAYESLNEKGLIKQVEKDFFKAV